MTPESVSEWIDRYIDAWRTYDPDAIAGLFTTDATYAYNPWGDALVGNAAIVESWLNDRDEPGSWSAEYRPVLVSGDTAIVVGETSYVGAATYSNLFQLEFDANGKCRSFTEWYMDQHKAD